MSFDSFLLKVIDWSYIQMVFLYWNTIQGSQRISRVVLRHMKTKRELVFFHFADPEKIVYCEIQPNRSEAFKREAAIKKLKRKDKLLLIETSTIHLP